MSDYCLETWYIRVSSRIAELLQTQNLKKLGNIRKFGKLHGMIAYFPVSLLKRKFSHYQQETLEKQKLIFSCCTPFHVKTRVGLKYFVNSRLLKLFFDYNLPHTTPNLIFLIFLVTLRLFTLFQPKIRAIEIEKSPKICLTW